MRPPCTPLTQRGDLATELLRDAKCDTNAWISNVIVAGEADSAVPKTDTAESAQLLHSH
jgi:hypothetical protein